MARNDKAANKVSKTIRDIAKGISGNMDYLYRNTYMTSPQQNKDLDDLNSRINNSIDKIVNKNIDMVGMPSVTKLYSRISEKSSKDNKIINDLEKMFDNGVVTDDLYSLFMSNRYLKELDNEIDTVCKYMPKLEEALAVQKDCILSADHFSKDFLNFETSISGEDMTIFSERVKDLKKKYNLSKLVEEIYENTSKYGEQFIYRVPFSTAIGKLLSVKPDSNLVAPTRGMNESMINDDTSKYGFKLSKDKFEIIDETGDIIHSNLSPLNESASSYTNYGNPTKHILRDKESFNIDVEICKSGILESAVKDIKSALDKRNVYSSSSLLNIYEQSINESGKDIKAEGPISFGNYSKDKRILSNDGLIGTKDTKPVDVKTLGCVIRKIPREQVVPIYIEDLCMGYYIFELRTTNNSDAFMGFRNMLGDPISNMKGDKGSVFNAVDTERQDETIKLIAGQLSSFIDKQFVNNNQDLAKEIYMILKYNDLFNTPSIDTIRVTFVPPEDMVHFFFRQDPITHRGISDLDKGLIPAKIYTSLYISAAIGMLTRGQDKRAYYVKQTVDTNIAQTLLNTISQIKQSNFGVRQFQNINNILNITGRFNDYVIPMNASGESPIQIEVIPGQDIQMPTDLMEPLEEAAINSTNIPLEIIQARQSVDYAIQLTMSSSKVLRFCYNRQELFQNDLTRLINPIYTCEYGESANINVVLPPPGFINIANTNQLIDNTKNFVQSIVDIDMASEEDEVLKNIYFNDLFKHYIGTHLDVATHEKILSRSKIKAKAKKNESHSDNATEDDGYDEY